MLGWVLLAAVASGVGWLALVATRGVTIPTSFD